MRTKVTVAAAVLIGMVCVVWQVERTAPGEMSRGVEGVQARSEGLEGSLSPTSASGRRSVTVTLPATNSLASQNADATRSEQEQEFIRLYRGQAEQRLRPLATASAERVLEMLPEGFCRLYPEQCDAMQANPQARMENLFELTSATDLDGYISDPEIRAQYEESLSITAWFEDITDYRTVEMDFARGQGDPTTIAQHLSQIAGALDSGVERSEKLWALIGEYGEFTMAYWAGEETSADRDTLESAIQALLWEERCRRENRMFSKMETVDGFWMHLSRVWTRDEYDDSYWIPGDEQVAWENDLPFYLDL